jgi:hypothetical protein
MDDPKDDDNRCAKCLGILAAKEAKGKKAGGRSLAKE